VGKQEIVIPATDLKDLYLNKRLNTDQIGKKFSCSDVTVRNKLHKLGVKLRRAWDYDRSKYQKIPFNGGMAEKAYIIGFRIGDLNVYKTSSNSKILIVRCHTTKKEQVDLINGLFKKYGHVNISRSKKHSYNVNCYLDESFGFLEVKVRVPRWIKKDGLLGWYFTAGYVDAEGSFGINQGRGRFKIDSYDQKILFWISKFLKNAGIKNKLRLIYKKNKKRYDGGIWKKDLWRLNINWANSLGKFIDKIYNLLKHKKRKEDSLKVLKNVKERQLYGSVKN